MKKIEVPKLYSSCMALCLSHFTFFVHVATHEIFTLILAKLPGLMRLCQENMEYKQLAAFVATTQLLASYSRMHKGTKECRRHMLWQ